MSACLDPVVKKHNIRIENKLKWNEEIYVNRPQLIQVFVNLYRNAAESLVSNSPHEKIIQTTTRLLNSSKTKELIAEITVSDNGSGFEPEMVLIKLKSLSNILGLAIIFWKKSLLKKENLMYLNVITRDFIKMFIFSTPTGQFASQEPQRRHLLRYL